MPTTFIFLHLHLSGVGYILADFPGAKCISLTNWQDFTVQSGKNRTAKRSPEVSCGFMETIVVRSIAEESAFFIGGNEQKLPCPANHNGSFR